MRYIFKLAHKSTAFFSKSIRNTYKFIRKTYKKTVLCLLTAELKGSNTGYILEDAVKTLV